MAGLLPRGVALLAATLLAVPTTAGAQSIRGRVLEDGREVPVADAVVSLIGADGKRRTEALCDTLGRFALQVPGAGDYVLEASRLGYTTTRSPLLKVAARDSASVDILLTPEPIGLPGLEVAAKPVDEDLLQDFGLRPVDLNRRWITHEDIETMPLPSSPREAIRWQAIPGVWVTPRVLTKIPTLCVSFTRAGGCAMVLLNEVEIPLSEAVALNPSDLEAIAILTPQEATTFYGERAANGVVLMWTRKGGR